jgi:hypothetical protein
LAKIVYDNSAIKAKLGELLDNNCLLAKEFHNRRRHEILLNG